MSNMLKEENYRFALQSCNKCGAKFPVIYQFKERSIAPFGFACRHIPNKEAGFTPVDQPTFDEWYEGQVYVRALLEIYEQKYANN